MPSKLKVFALGGLNEVGKNCYCFEGEETMIVVDCGIKFVSDNNLVDSQIPDYSYLIENKKKLRGLFVTHGHEDHIGAIPYLLRSIPDLPVYGSEFSISLLQGKLKGKYRDKIHVFKDESVIKNEEFRISFFSVTHSIPGAYGLFIEFLPENFKIVVTGDFKFDWNAIGSKTDLVKLIEYKKKEVDLLLSDSTNALVSGTTPSESRVIKNIEKIIVEAEGMIIVTFFASKFPLFLERFTKIVQKKGRKIAVLGSSLKKNMQIMNKIGLLKIESSSIFIKEEEINKIAEEKLVIFCTGSQGEKRAALMKIAEGINPYLKLKKNPKNKKKIIIFSSSPIMDNKYEVELMMQKLSNLGVKMYENNPESKEGVGLTHVSGHASESDLRLMLNIVEPRFFIPFHGDQRMLLRHGKLAEETLKMNKENIFILENGEIVELELLKKKILSLKRKKMVLESKFLLNDKVISSGDIEKKLLMRKKMSRAGVLILIISQKSHSEDISFYIFTCGFIDMKKNKNMFDDLKNKINQYLKNNRESSNEELKKYVEKELWVEEKPLVHIIKK